MLERRRTQRVPVNHEFGAVEQFITEYVSDLSATGAFIRSKNPLPTGTRVNLKFTVFASEIETLEGIGEVVRVSQQPLGMGVAFTQLTPHSKQVIRHLTGEHVR